MLIRIALLFFVPIIFCFGSSPDSQKEYVENYLMIAAKEKDRSGIPISIKLGQALLESSGGSSILARRANNHFGIKCKSSWTGQRYFYTDDDRDADGNLVPSCFRMYDSVESSYRDHSDFLMNSSRYSRLFEYEATDYIAWANGLTECGYATDKSYATKLIRKIESLQLHQYDQVD